MQKIIKKRKKRIHTDKRGREYIKESNFEGGKMKHRRVYVIEGMPAQECYEQNGTDIDFYMNGDYELMKNETNYRIHSDPQNGQSLDSSDSEEPNDLPF